MSAQEQYYGQNRGTAQIGGFLHERTSKVRKLGIAEIILGFLVFVVGIATLVLMSSELKKHYRTVDVKVLSDTPLLWCGAVAINTGAWALRVTARPIKLVHILNMIMSIICSLVALAALVLSGVKASQYVELSPILVAVHAGMAVLNSALVFVGVAHAALCQRGACYDQIFDSGTQQTVNPPQQYVVAP